MTLYAMRHCGGADLILVGERRELSGALADGMLWPLTDRL